jgi:hypothetical protein
MPVRNTSFGVIVPPKDPAAITAAIIRLRDNELDREAGAAATRVRYQASTVIDRYREVFAQLPAPR